MKISAGFSILILSAVVFSGCATGACQKNKACGDSSAQYVPPVETVQPAAPVSQPVVVTPVEPAEDYIPAAVKK